VAARLDDARSFQMQAADHSCKEHLQRANPYVSAAQPFEPRVWKYGFIDLGHHLLARIASDES